MIVFNGLNSDENLPKTIKAILTWKKIPRGARILAINILLKNERWCGTERQWWEAADEINTNKENVCFWRNQLEKQGVWQISEALNEKGFSEIKIVFLSENFSLDERTKNDKF